MESMTAAEYKAAKEASVTGLLGGSMSEVNVVTGVALTTFLCWAIIQKYHPRSPSNQVLHYASGLTQDIRADIDLVGANLSSSKEKKTLTKQGQEQTRLSWKSFVVDFSILVVPMLLSCTLFADYAYLWSFAILTFGVVVWKIVGPSEQDVIKKEKQKFKWKASDDEEEDDDEAADQGQGQHDEGAGIAGGDPFDQDGDFDASTQGGHQQQQQHIRQRKSQRVDIGEDHDLDNDEQTRTAAKRSHKRSKRRAAALAAANKPQEHRIFLSVYRAGMMILTCVAILAVDFNVFPRRFGKVEVYGTSLMDLGVGSFVFSSGVVAARQFLKPEIPPFSKQIVTSLRDSAILLILGFGRFLSVKGVEYQEHVTEYGVHWNFFFTLGFLPIFVTLFRSLAYYTRFSAVSLLVACGYQIALSYGGLEDYIQKAPRTDLISMNKEGIFSFAGFLAIFLMGIDVGLYALPNDPYYFGRRHIDDQGRKLPIKKQKKGKLAMILLSLSFLLGMGFLVSFGIMRIPVSRQMANLSYYFWVVTFNTTFIMCFLLAEVFFTLNEPSPAAIQRALAKASVSTTSGKKTTSSSSSSQLPAVILPPLTCPPLLEAVNKNGLAVFLFANIMTGLINLNIKTLYTSDRNAIIILTVYMALVCALAWFLQQKGWRLKL